MDKVVSVSKSFQTPTFAWEHQTNLKSAQVTSSKSRYEIIQFVVNSLKLSGKRRLKEKIECILEELLTNAIYHAYKKGGSEKYLRKENITLPESEKITVTHQQDKRGFYLSVKDQGGNLEFSEIARAFDRCYGSGSFSQIDSKESGAGLGMYLVFEAVTYLKIVSTKNKSTTVSCWVDNENEKHHDHFRFDFYREE